MASGGPTTSEAVDLDAVFERLVAGLDALPSSAALQACADFRGRLDAVEAKVLAAVVAADAGDARRAQRQQDPKQTSRRERARRAKRGAVVAENPALGEAMASGELCGEQVDLLASASEKSDGAAAHDQRLIDRLGAVGPDQGRKVVNDWLARRARAADVQAAHDRARKIRRARRYATADGLAGIALEGDSPAIDRMWKTLLDDANRAYHTAGGRDMAAQEHERSYDQRLFDAAQHHLTGTDPTAAETPDVGPATPEEPAAPGARSNRPITDYQPRLRPLVVITLSLDKALGLAPDHCAQQLGIGPIADKVVAEYLPYADIIGLLFDSNGQPLRLGRSVRNATRGQLIALFARDQCCVLCGAGPDTCHAHHLIPWNAPAAGPTDIDNLALVCPRCHHQLHAAQQTLHHDATNQLWNLEPAQPHERPPPRPTPRE